MDFSSLSGLFVVAGIGVALTMFVPAWAKRSQTVHEVREVSRTVKQTARAQVAAKTRAVRHTSVTPDQLATQLARLAVARRLLAYAFIAAFIGVSIAAFNLASLWLVAVISASVAAISLVSNRALAARQEKLVIDQRAVRAVPRVAYRDLYRQVESQTNPAPAEADDRSWTPRHMPAPLHAGHIGSLEQPVLAKVAEIRPAAAAAKSAQESSVVEPVGANLDEILRRRRAV